MCGLVLLLSFYFERIFKVKQVVCCDCVMDLSLIVFQTDPVNFVLNQKCSGQTEYMSRLGIAWNSGARSRRLHHGYIKIIPLY